jgi:acetyltransferase
MKFDLSSLLKPKSIALIGASRDPTRIGGRTLGYLTRHGYSGTIFPVNPKYEEIGGMKCYPTVTSIPSEIDVAIIAVPEEAVLSVLEEAGHRRVKAAIIYSAGFSELGPQGRSKQEHVKRLAEDRAVSVCGPNCAGVINFHHQIAMSFSQFLEVPRLIPGNIAFISQSGALGGALLNRIQDRGIGISYFISTGNEAVLESSDFIEYLLDDPATSVIMAIIEGIRDGKKLLRVADLAAEREKPLVVMKIGRTEAGGKAAISHTGSMTGSDAAYDAVFRQTGAIRVEEIEDLYVTASALAKCRLPSGNRVGIISTTGGGGVILTDKLVEMGMVVADLSPRTTAKIAETAASFGVVKNPLDLTAQVINDPLLFPKAVETFSQDENLDATIVALAMVAGETSGQRASYIIQAANSTEKPILTWWAAGSLSRPGTKMLEESRVPLFSSPDQCAKTLDALVRYSQFLKTAAIEGEKAPLISLSPRKRSHIKTLLKASSMTVSDDGGSEILCSYGIPVPSGGLGKDLTEIKEIASRIGYPVALKIVSPQIRHKTDARGLKLSISNDIDLAGAYEEILRNVKRYNPEAEMKGMLVQEMVPTGKEIIIGVTQDMQFGPMVLFGLGGIFTEILNDFSLRHAPLTEKDAWEMIREVKAYGILEGTRGDERLDLEGIVRTLMAVSQLAVDFVDVISEIDINPLVVYPEKGGVKAVDWLIVTKEDVHGQTRG